MLGRDYSVNRIKLWAD